MRFVTLFGVSKKLVVGFRATPTNDLCHFGFSFSCSLSGL
jgi:hypothetical protein